MNANGNVARIWQPVIEPNDRQVPLPGSQQAVAGASEGLLFTKSSLANNNQSQDNLQADIRQYNREVLAASQSFNNSPKPFARPTGSEETRPRQALFGQTKQQVSLISSEHNDGSPSGLRVSSSPFKVAASLSNSPQTPKFRSQLSQVAEISSDSEQTNAPEVTTRKQQVGSEQQEGENMAPKLVHKQYNSPLDLYSMNNIRKTIEAHTELIAPGLKGINFMKPETPVNRQSEVYKLVMEEERGQRGASAARMSPISGQPVSTAAAAPPQHHHHYQDQHQHQIQQQQYLQAEHQLNQHQEQQQQQQSRTISRQAPAGPQPKCFECGQLISGPFARVQNRCVHPQCFNCSTCGTSLKNVGYFTVNDKLYCEIHAKQVADIMHISYDFGAQRAQAAASGRLQQQQSVSSTTSELQGGAKPASAYPAGPATISTMFANRAGGETAAGSGEVRWAWRPMTASERCDTSTEFTTNSASSGHFNRSAVQSQQHTVQPLPAGNQAPGSGEPQLLGVRGRGLLQEGGSLVGGRIPVCAHCQTQIHGPYILAGKSSWCKACSMSQFNCFSCKRNLLNIGFIEDSFHKFYCELCFEAYHAPICSKCNIRIKGDCLNALQKQWHPSCFVCGHCRRPFGNSSFYLEDNVPYCERDWNQLFTTKCYACSFPIQAGDKWIEALERNYHSSCFRCTSCQANLEGSTFYCKNGRPYCRLHAR